MQRFTVGEPPEETGASKEDLARLFSWCRELYQSLWMIYFLGERENREEGQE